MARRACRVKGEPFPFRRAIGMGSDLSSAIHRARPRGTAMQAMPSPWIGRGWTQEAMIGGALRDVVPSETGEISERGLGIRRRRWNAPGNRHKRSLRVLKFMLHLHRPYAKCPYPLGCARG